MSKIYSARHYAILACALCFAGTSLLAQTAPTPAPAPGQPEEVIVEGVPPDQSILPTARPISSIYGTDMDIVDIPRDVSTITKEQVDERQITSVDDLGQFASGTYTASIFGAEGLPQIRGIPAEIYQNGQREHYYLNSFPPSFNGSESIDVVKGPGTAVYGPASQGLGGYVNLVTKQPFFDGQHTEITTVLGDFYEGGQSYGRYQWQIDNSGPLIKDKLAYRFSYLGRESSGYYRNISDNVEDIFGALTYNPTTNLSFNLTGQFYESKFNENAG
jgi:outer membrane receptor protein involved in Fe transport